MNFNLKKTKIFQAVKWGQYPIFKFANFFKKIFLVLFAFLFLVFLYGIIADALSQKIQKISLGLAIIFLVFSLINWLLESFLNSRLKKPKLELKISEIIKNPEGYNLAEFLSFEAAIAAWESIKFARAKNFSEVNSSILFHYLILDNPKLNFIFSRALLDLNQVKKIIEAQFKLLKKGEFTGIFSDDFQNTIFESLKIAQQKGHPMIEIGDVLTGLAKYDPIFKKILTDADLKIKDIENLSWWLEDLENKAKEGRKFWEWQNLIQKEA